MYTVSKLDTPDRGTLYAVGAGDSIVSRFTDEEEAKEACTLLNGGEKAEKKLAAAEEAAKEAAKKAEADRPAPDKGGFADYPREDAKPKAKAHT